MTRLLAAILAGSVIAGCDRGAPTAQPPAPAATAIATSDLGALSMSLSRTEMSTIDRLHVQFALEHRGGVSAGELRFGAEESGWTVAAAEASMPAILADGRVRLSWNYTLEPFLDGSYQVPPASIDLSDGVKTATLSTPPQSVEVTSVLTEDAPELAPSRPPVETEQRLESTARPLVIGGGFAAVVLSGLVIWWWRHAKNPIAGASGATGGLPMGARGEVERLRRELRDRLSARVGQVPASATSEEMLAIARSRLTRELGDRVGHVLARMDRLTYGPDDPCQADLEALSRELASLELSAQEARA